MGLRCCTCDKLPGGAAAGPRGARSAAGLLEAPVLTHSCDRCLQTCCVLGTGRWWEHAQPCPVVLTCWLRTQAGLNQWTWTFPAVGRGRPRCIEGREGISPILQMRKLDPESLVTCLNVRE